MPEDISVASQVSVLVIILYFIVVPVSLSVAETVRLSLVPPTVVVMVGAVVSFVHEAEVAVVCQLPAASRTEDTEDDGAVGE